MIIYVLRHGQAEPPVISDELRKLTQKGMQDTTKILKPRLETLAGLTEIWASPLVRAQQTAQIAQHYFPGIALQTSALLVPEADPALVIEWLSNHSAAGVPAILLVSHQPLVSMLLEVLCGKPEGFYPMDTSSLAAVNLDLIGAGLGQLLWLDHITH
jgi:phosphohistidine phosphatase